MCQLDLSRISCTQTVASMYIDDCSSRFGWENPDFNSTVLGRMWHCLPICTSYQLSPYSHLGIVSPWEAVYTPQEITCSRYHDYVQYLASPVSKHSCWWYYSLYTIQYAVSWASLKFLNFTGSCIIAILCFQVQKLSTSNQQKSIYMVEIEVSFPWGLGESFPCLLLTCLTTHTICNWKPPETGIALWDGICMLSDRVIYVVYGNRDIMHELQLW